MQIKRVELKDHHIYGNSIIDFCTVEDDTRLNTLSGINGSGKSTIFSLVALVQKAYFCILYKTESDLETYNKIYKIVSNEISESLKSKYSEVILFLTIEKDDIILIKNTEIINLWETTKDDNECVDIRIALKTNNHDWKIDIDSNQNRILNSFWNLKNPIRLIVYIPAEKLVEEADVKYDDVRLVSKRGLSQKLKIIFDFTDIYNNLYSIILNDYIMQRINPKNGKRRVDYYVLQSKVLFHELIPSIDIGNTSAVIKENQFIITANRKRARNHQYELRDFSSGEKLIWYSSVLLNYIKNIGVLIIDEPENHLHEDLLWRFTKLLYRVISEPKSDISLSEVFFLTHSKNLIYNNFTIGKNYIVDNGCVQLLKYDGCEDILRNLGVSCLNEKILFVEGKTDQSSLSEAFSTHNIKVVVLGNCQDIIAAYTGIQKLSSYVQDKQFVFLLDRDTRDSDDINHLRDKNIKYFDEHFVVMDRREIENYYLDVKTIKKTIDKICDLLGSETISEDNILNIIKSNADKLKDDTKKAYLNGILQIKAHGFANMINKKDIKISSKSDYEKYLNEVFASADWTSIMSKMKDSYDDLERKYSDLEWESNWLMLCDGKGVFEKSITDITKIIGVKHEVLRSKIIRDCLDNNKSDISDLINRIVDLY